MARPGDNVEFVWPVPFRNVMVALDSVLRAERAVLWHEYEFGDSWRHRIEVEKILPLDPDLTYPRCTGGRRAASPAEDIGGLRGLEEIVRLVEHPQLTPPEDFEDLVTDLRERVHRRGRCR